MADDTVQTITKGYTFDEASMELGVLIVDGSPVPDAKIRIPLSMLNRHGLIAGATGTGKTKTLQLLTEQISAAGVPVFAADIKGDLSGLASPGASSDKLLARTQAIGQDWKPLASPVEFFALGGQGQGVPVRCTMTAFGPTLLSKVLGLTDVQESSLGLVFHFADQRGLPLLDIADLRAVLTYLGSDEGKLELKDLGGLAASTVGVLLRELIGFSDQGADLFFGEPEFQTSDFLRTTADGRGVISLLELPNLVDRPAVFSTFLMWMLADLFHDLPEVGDVEKPKLVFFFDEAHLLFADASKSFLQAIAQTVRLIRVQHALRAHTPNDAKALKQTVNTYPTSSYDLEQVLQNLGIGEAIVTVMDPNGAPTPVAWTRMRAPQSLMGATDPAVLAPGIAGSALMAKYGQAIDRDSAQEMLARKVEQGAAAAEEQARASADAEQQTKDQAAAQKEAAAQQKAADRAAATQQRQAPQQKSIIEEVAQSSIFKQFVRTAGNEIVRGIFGTARRR